MSALPLPADGTSLTEQTMLALAARIEAGEFAPARKLPSEGELVASYGVSRTVVREAISQLRARGLVETRRGIGTFARQPRGHAFTLPRIDQRTLAEVVALLELRISLETEAAALAASRATKAHVARLGVILEAMHAAARAGSNAADADFDFHLALAEATGNHYFSDLIRHLGRSIIPRTRIDSPAVAQLDRAEYVRTVNREHEDIFRAVARGDADAARAAMRTHLANSRERLRHLRDRPEEMV